MDGFAIIDHGAHIPGGIAKQRRVLIGYGTLLAQGESSKQLNQVAI
jgi:hypothetical protein